MDVNRVMCGDALDVLRGLEPASVDAIICDPPYGTTACAWDTVVPFEPMWAAFKRIIKPRGAIVMTASQPFTSALVMSNPKMFKYAWVWEKTNAVDFTMVKFRPRKMHEDVVVFSAERHNYFPQMEWGRPYIDKPRKRSNNIFGSIMPNLGIINTGERFPSSVQRFSNGNNHTEHPTQKPLALMAYLIRTYTQPGDLVVDPFAGSGTTLVAARNLGRRYFGCDTSPEYVAIAERRLSEMYTPDMFETARAD